MTLLDKREVEESDEESKSVVGIQDQVSGLAKSKSLLMLILFHC